MPTPADVVQSQTPKTSTPQQSKSKHKPRGKGNPNKKGLAKPHSRAPLPKSVATYALYAHYAVYYSFHTFSENINVVYDVLVSRDRKLEEMLSVHLLRYAALVAAYARVFSVRIREGVAFPTPISKTLLEYASYLHLPEFLASAIETVGVVSHDDRTYVPWVPHSPRKTEKFFRPLVRSYAELTGVDTDDISEALNSRILLGFQTALVRGLKSGVAFRKVDFDKSAGSEHSLACLDTIAGNRVRGLSAWVMSEPVCQHGALWGWRKSSDVRPNRGMTHTLHYGFATKEFDHQLLLVESCAASFK